MKLGSTLSVVVVLFAAGCGGAGDPAGTPASVSQAQTAKPEAYPLPVIDPNPCTPEMCGPQPVSRPVICEDGSIGGFTGRCVEDLTDPRVPATPICVWEYRECPAPVACGVRDCAAGETCCDSRCGMCAPAGISCADLDQVCPPWVCEPDRCGKKPEIEKWHCDDGTDGYYTGRCVEDPNDPRVPPFAICGWEFVGCAPPSAGVAPATSADSDG